MSVHLLRTHELAKAVDIHANTIRLYEEWGCLPPIPRSPSGYRLFTQLHLDQLRLARLMFGGGWGGRALRRSAELLVRQAAWSEMEAALETAHLNLGQVRAEQAQAEEAVAFPQEWVGQGEEIAAGERCWIGEAACALGVTRDVLRNWERNGLLRVPRDSRSGYRIYGRVEMGRLRVIRMLRQAGYSMMAILRMVLVLDGLYGEDPARLREALDTPRPDEAYCIPAAADRWLSWLSEEEARTLQAIEMLNEMAHKRGI
jgi:DNA-binding transcriptional MerR regulator